MKPTANGSAVCVPISSRLLYRHQNSIDSDVDPISSPILSNVQLQLGLKLDAVKVPMEMIVSIMSRKRLQKTYGKARRINYPQLSGVVIAKQSSRRHAEWRLRRYDIIDISPFPPNIVQIEAEACG